MGSAVHPFPRVPDWGAMETPFEWNRSYGDMESDDFVDVPAYDIAVLTTPVRALMEDRARHIPELTAKLYYSTRHMGRYDLDAGEYVGNHPGLDLKMPRGAPIRAIGGGRVQEVAWDEELGLRVIIEHRIPGRGDFFSIYGHLDQAWVREGQEIAAGEVIGTVGMTGKTTGPHLHLQIDRGTGEHPHVPYHPGAQPLREEADARTVHPVRFIEENR
jgi:murein DD-endopeptidase MepM/ murein hydrolase activator NlpD